MNYRLDSDSSIMLLGHVKQLILKKKTYELEINRITVLNPKF